MNRSRLFWLGLAPYGLGTLVVAGCGEAPTAAVEVFHVVHSAEDAHLLECPAVEARSAAAVIGPRGGSVELDGHLLAMPPGTLPHPAQVVLSEPASPYLEVDIGVGGQPSASFRRPVRVAISYARCAAIDESTPPLSAWHIDPETKTLLEKMNARDDRASRRVEFDTYHFSGFAIAN